MKIVKILAGSIMLVIMTVSIQACVIELINDSNQPVLIVTDDFKEGMMVPNNGTFTFGSKNYMANFRVMKQNSKNFSEQYHLQQTACTPTKFLKLKLSEINSNSNIPFNISQPQQKIIPVKSSCGCSH